MGSVCSCIGKDKQEESGSNKEQERLKSSSSSEEKHRSSSSSSEKQRDKDKHRESSDKHREHGDDKTEGDKHKEKHRENKKNREEKKQAVANVTKVQINETDDEGQKLTMNIDVRLEPKSPVKEATPVKSLFMKEEPMSEDTVHLSKRVKKEKPVKRELPESDDEDDQPLSARQEEEEMHEEDIKWRFLEHKGVLFAPDYEPLPDNVKFYYNENEMKLTQETEEVATFYARILDLDYTSIDVFNNNFFKDWRKVMTSEEREIITDLKKCNFKEIYAYFKRKLEEKKSRSKEEKQIEKKKNEEIMAEYGTCIMDGQKEKIGNFRVEPPDLFRGRGNHPKQGMLKKRILPEDVIINCSKDSKIPSPPPGHKWKEVRHDQSVLWGARWKANVQRQYRYMFVMPIASPILKGIKDLHKFDTGRKLNKFVDSIREGYRNDWKSKEMRIRQRAVALYFIDKLALMAGDEEDEGETADTVGCCSLRVEHLKLHETYDDQEFVVEFDFLDEDSFRYYNRVPVEKRVFKNLQFFMENKQPGDDLFDTLNTTILNKHLQDLMEGLTAKVFHMFNASKTLQEQLKLLTDPDDKESAKLLSYNKAMRAVAILCNHQHAVPKNFAKQMENLQKDENTEIALGTIILYYIDPRISVAWCKKWDVPLDKVFNKTQREKFKWAFGTADESFEF